MPVTFRPPRPEDEAEFCNAATRSADLHHPWVSAPHTPDGFQSYLTKYDGQSNLSYLVFNEDAQLVGCINLNEIVRGAFQSAYLGYYAFAPFQQQGLMKQALALVIAETFGPLEMHRLEANIQPGNEASIRLVCSLGFRHEGTSPRYLKIDGEWRDHERYAITQEDWRASTASTK